MSAPKHGNVPIVFDFPSIAARLSRLEARRGRMPVPVPTIILGDLKRIRGIGAHIERKLQRLGIQSIAQIAAWTSADIGRISVALDVRGRIEREHWVEQARILAAGGQTEFSRRSGDTK